MKILTISFLLLLSFPFQAKADFPWSKYKNTALDVLIALGESAKEDTKLPRRFLFVPPQRYRAIVKYTGKIKDLSEELKLFFEDYRIATKAKTSMDEIYQKEIQVIEDNKYYWLPIQKQLIQHLKAELKPNQKFEIYFIWRGAYFDKYIFTINEFNSELAYRPYNKN